MKLSMPEVIVKPRPVKGQRACDACGYYHGGVNMEIMCLRKHLHEAREDLREARLALASR